MGSEKVEVGSGKVEEGFERAEEDSGMAEVGSGKELEARRAGWECQCQVPPHQGLDLLDCRGRGYRQVPVGQQACGVPFCEQEADAWSS